VEALAATGKAATVLAAAVVELRDKMLSAVMEPTATVATAVMAAQEMAE
jgi:hypothetical protein